MWKTLRLAILALILSPFLFLSGESAEAGYLPDGTMDGAPMSVNITITVYPLVGPNVTISAATGIMNTSATLNGIITEDGNTSCNVTWFWGLTDEGETTSWTYNATQTGLHEGAISYNVVGTLTPSTLYYFIIYVANIQDADWSASGNFTTITTGAGGFRGKSVDDTPIDETAEYGGYIKMTTAFYLIIFIAFFSVLAFWKQNALLFMVLFAITFPVSMAVPDLISTKATTTPIDIAVSMGVLAYGLLCAAWSFRLLFWRGNENG